MDRKSMEVKLPPLTNYTPPQWRSLLSPPPPACLLSSPYAVNIGILSNISEVLEASLLEGVRRLIDPPCTFSYWGLSMGGFTS